MNESLVLNDTFDNFSFTFCDNKGHIKCDSHNQSARKIQTESLPKDIEEHLSDLFQNSISFDDSKFLNEVFDKSSETVKKKEEQKSIITNISYEDSKLNNDLSFETKHVLGQHQNSSLQTNNTAIKQSFSELENVEGTLNNSDKIYTNNNTEKSFTDAKEHNCALSLWGLPNSILHKYQKKNVFNMFPWQAECLGNLNVLKNCAHLVYSAPTSAGKTLVAEILAIKTILERHKKVLFILPYVSVVREKMFYFQDLLKDSGVRVEGFMGSYNPPGGFKSIQFAICTIEKANSLINRLLDENTLSDVGAVVVDEMHLIGDPSRGYLLELLLTKLKYMSIKDKNINIQIIGMSATLPNLNLLSKWLGAELYLSSYRPVPLIEQVHVHGHIFDNKLKLIRNLQNMPELGIDTDNVLQLCLETILGCCSVLIFCPTKVWCESLAQQISLAFWKLGCSKTDMGMSLRKQLSTDAITELLQQLKKCPTGLDQELGKTVSFGVAFHHAGLTMDERDIIEGAFRSGTLRVLVATSTLSSGVNLPARRVIIRTPIFHGKPIDNLTYRQMIGRAGRMGRDSLGESFLICQKNDYKIAQELLSTELLPIESCLEGSGKLKRAILEVIASGVATSPEEVKLFTDCTLLAAETNNDENEMINPIDETIDFFKRNEFIRLQKQEDSTYKYIATSLGKACLSSSLPPEEGLALFAELEKARQCFVLETELHLIYLVTPYSVCYQLGNLDWMLFLDIWEKLPPSMKRVGDLVGITESYIINASRGRIQTKCSKLLQKQMIHKRFYTALALQELVNEVPLNKVASKYNCSRGLLQSLQQSASTFAGMVTSFSHQLGWSSVEILISQFQDRLHFGVNRDLLELMKLPILNGPRARALHNAGIKSLVDLARADVCTVENILYKVVPFESGKERDGELEHEVHERNKFRAVWVTGKQGVTEREAAEALIKDARMYIMLEMGLKDINWDESHNKLSSSSSENISLTSQPCSNKDNTSELNNSEIRFNKSDDVIATSQNESISDVGKSYSTSAFTLTKRKRKTKVNNMTENSFGEVMCNKTPTKKKKIVITDNADTKLLCEKIDSFKTLTAGFKNIEIIDVCKNKRLFNVFCEELTQKNTISLTLACEKIPEVKPIIGMKILNQEEIKDQPNSRYKTFIYKERNVVGVAITWGSNTAYYLSLDDCDIIIDNRMKLLTGILTNKHVTVRMFDCKEHIKILKMNCNVNFLGHPEDPKVGDWLLDPDGKEKNLQAMTLKYVPKTVNLCQIAGNCKGVSSVSLDLNSAINPRIRACVESIICWHLMNAVYVSLYEQDVRLIETFETEMKTILCLAKMELNGFPVNTIKLKKLVDDMEKQTYSMEKNAYEMAGRRFSITSSNDVAKVLRIYKGGHKISTNKQVLEKSENPISDIIIQWRKLNGILGKTILPLFHQIENDRIHGSVITHHSTGRISMQEPNLQNIAKNFEIEDQFNKQNIVFSCRSVFECAKGNVLLSVDYCQIELRILAHLSQDDILCTIMKSKEDVFRLVAAEWNNITELEVNDILRQRAKQICYGIIYGIGIKTLSEQMGVSENSASEFMQTFHNKYPNIKKFINLTIKKCEQNGYVETIAGRRRYLPHINHSNLSIKAQAERQAVNTTIQGSAADIAKSAMVLIENKIQEKFSASKHAPKLVLNLHDEFIYEVPSKYLQNVCKIVKKYMEQVTTLSVPLPVRLKTGCTWGDLKEVYF